MNELLSTGIVLASAQMEPRLFDLDFQLLADTVLTMISVFVLFLLLSYFLFNPARAMLRKRQEKITGELESARVDQLEAAKLREDYEDRLKNIQKEAEEILNIARKKALENENRIVSNAREEAVRIIQRAQTEAELEKRKAADEVKREMVSIASLMAGKVVSAAINTSIQDSLVDETQKEIGESTWLS